MSSNNFIKDCLEVLLKKANEEGGEHKLSFKNKSNDVVTAVVLVNGIKVV